MCGVNVTWENLEEHMHDCPQKPIVCDMCFEICVLEFSDAHKKKCAYKRVKCGFDCGFESNMADVVVSSFKKTKQRW